MFILRLLFLSFFAFTVYGADTYVDKDCRVSLQPYGKYALLSFNLRTGIKFYWRNPGEMGLATEFNFKDSNNLKSAKLHWPVPTLYQENNITSYVYKENVDFVIETIANNTEKDIFLSVHSRFTICGETCETRNIDLETKLNSKVINNQPTEITNALSKTPQKNGTGGVEILFINEVNVGEENWLKIEVKTDQDLINPKLFVDAPDHVSFDPVNYSITKEFNNQVINFPITFTEGKKTAGKIYLNLVGDNGHTIEYEISKVSETEYSLFLIILYALLGGLILNFMPCVLPIIGLKALQIIKLSGKANGIIRKNLVIQSLGIILSFAAFAFITFILKQAGEEVGFGLQFQQPSYLITMVIILSIIAISLVDKISFNIKISDHITNYFSSSKKDSLSSFFSGILVTLLALPCTAPFVTIAIGFALTTDFFRMLIIFIMMGIGMSLPYLLLSIYPNIGKILPKPGSWMISFKKILGILIFITSIWLIYVISNQLGNKAAITLFLLMILIKFILIERKLFGNKLKALLVLILIILSYIIPYNLYEEKQYEDILIEDTWQEYNQSQINSLIEDDKIILLDISASWCATCKLNKFTTLDNSVVLNFMKLRGIIGMRADITKNLSPEVSTLMKMHKHFGIPFTIIYSKKYPNGKVLKTILSANYLISELKEIN